MRTMEGHSLVIPNSVASKDRLEVFRRGGPADRADPARRTRIRRAARAGSGGAGGRGARRARSRAASVAGRLHLQRSTPPRSLYELRYWLEDYAHYLEIDSRSASGSGITSGARASVDRVPGHPPASVRRAARSRVPRTLGDHRRRPSMRSPLFAPLSRGERRAPGEGRDASSFAEGEIDRPRGRDELVDVPDRTGPCAGLGPRGPIAPAQKLAILDRAPRSARSAC